MIPRSTERVKEGEEVKKYGLDASRRVETVMQTMDVEEEIDRDTYCSERFLLLSIGVLRLPTRQLAFHKEIVCGRSSFGLVRLVSLGSVFICGLGVVRRLDFRHSGRVGCSFGVGCAARGRGERLLMMGVWRGIWFFDRAICTNLICVWLCLFYLTRFPRP